MTVAGQIKKGAYFDSVTLMRVGKELAGLPGVADAGAAPRLLSAATLSVPPAEPTMIRRLQPHRGHPIEATPTPDFGVREPPAGAVH